MLTWKHWVGDEYCFGFILCLWMVMGLVKGGDESSTAPRAICFSSHPYFLEKKKHGCPNTFFPSLEKETPHQWPCWLRGEADPGLKLCYCSISPNGIYELISSMDRSSCLCCWGRGRPWQKQHAILGWQNTKTQADIFHSCCFIKVKDCG